MRARKSTHATAVNCLIYETRCERECLESRGRPHRMAKRHPCVWLPRVNRIKSSQTSPLRNPLAPLAQIYVHIVHMDVILLQHVIRNNASRVRFMSGNLGRKESKSRALFDVSDFSARRTINYPLNYLESGKVAI